MLSCGELAPESRFFGRSPRRAPAPRLLFNFVASSSRFSTNANDVIGPTPRIERIRRVCGYFSSPNCSIFLS